jgi:phosphomannomutase
LGQSIALKEIPAEKFRFIMDTHHSVATVIVPKVVKEAEVVEAQAETAETAEGESEAAA